jgi:hypothetical protein
MLQHTMRPAGLPRMVTSIQTRGRSILSSLSVCVWRARDGSLVMDFELQQPKQKQQQGRLGGERASDPPSSSLSCNTRPAAPRSPPPCPRRSMQADGPSGCCSTASFLPREIRSLSAAPPTNKNLNSRTTIHPLCRKSHFLQPRIMYCGSESTAITSSSATFTVTNLDPHT